MLVSAICAWFEQSVVAAHFKWWIRPSWLGCTSSLVVREIARYCQRHVKNHDGCETGAERSPGSHTGEQQCCHEQDEAAVREVKGELPRKWHRDGLRMDASFAK